MPTGAMATARIVIIDDQYTNVAIAQRVLRRAGYARVRGLTDPRAALAICREWDPDLIVLDLHMPDLDGVAFLQALQTSRSATGFVPVLVLTSDTTREALKSAFVAGANDYVTKPIDADELELRVHNLLSIRLSHEDLKNTNAELAAELRDRARFDDEQAALRAQRVARIRRAIDEGGPTMVVQPIVELTTRRTIGFEALARFMIGVQRTPDTWFAEAATVGLGGELERCAVNAALQLLPQLPPELFLAINVSAATMLTGEFRDLVHRTQLDRIVFEITEHEPIDDYDAQTAVTTELRRHGARIAVDDAGAGYASLQHILHLAPDFIKIDIEFIRHIDSDLIKQALAAALVRFGSATGATVIAEGIETADELACLSELGISYGQGFHLAHPEAFPLSVSALTTLG